MSTAAREDILLAIIRGANASTEQSLQKLVCEAMEYRRLHSAMVFLSDQGFCIDSQDFRAALSSDDIYSTATMNGWKDPT